MGSGRVGATRDCPRWANRTPRLYLWRFEVSVPTSADVGAGDGHFFRFGAFPMVGLSPRKPPVKAGQFSTCTVALVPVKLAVVA